MKYSFITVAILVFLCVFLFHAKLTASWRDVVRGGYVVITDGDTIKMGRIRYRLYGIDAPELRQFCRGERGKNFACGEKARKALRGLVRGRSVICQPTGAVSYRRKIATCFVGGVDMGAWMVRRGWAVAYRRFSKKYIKLEEDAKIKKRGIWGGDFLMPWKWRQGKRLQ